MTAEERSREIVPTAELWPVLEQSLGRRIATVTRRPSEYRSSFSLEEIDVTFNDGRSLALLFKDTSPRALLDWARDAKPEFLRDPRREIEVYLEFLVNGASGAPVCHGTVVDPAKDQYWLFLERITGTELYQIGDPRVWHEAAAHLARMHTSFAPVVARTSARRSGLLCYDEAFYRQWLDRALSFREDGAGDFLHRLAKRYDGVVGRLSSVPRTVIHGEFYASNVLVEENAAGLRIRPVDWEMAGFGCGLLDLAALIAGKWSEEQRAELALSYHAALPASHCYWREAGEFLQLLDCCRLHQAVQWLGWSRTWSPPAEHAHDWLKQAQDIGKRLGLI
jgi:hypothetical protein